MVIVADFQDSLHNFPQNICMTRRKYSVPLLSIYCIGFLERKQLRIQDGIRSEAWRGSGAHGGRGESGHGDHGDEGTRYDQAHHHGICQ